MSSRGEFREQIQAGQLRVLAVTSARRVPGVDAPTLREGGVDLEFANWRGLVAPPGIGASRPAGADTALVDALHRSPEWAQVALARMSVTDAYLTGDAFGAFLRRRTTRVGGLLQRLGWRPDPPGAGQREAGRSARRSGAAGGPPPPYCSRTSARPTSTKCSR